MNLRLTKIATLGTVLFSFGLMLNQCAYDDVNLTVIQISGVEMTNDDAIAAFLDDYEAVLLSMGFDIRDSYAEDGMVDANIYFGGGDAWCFGKPLEHIIHLHCSETWRPLFTYFWPRVSREHNELMAEITVFAKLYGVEFIKRQLYNTDTREMTADEVIGR